MTTRFKNPRIRPYGRHGYQPTFGFVEPDPGFGFDGKRVMGLALVDHFIYGGLRSLDGKKYFSFFRHYNNQGAIGFAAFEATRDERGQHSDFRFNQQAAKAYLGAALTNQCDGIWGVRDIFAGKPKFEVRAWRSGASWFEQDLVDLTAEATFTVGQFCVPDSESPLVYNTRCLRAQGSFLGHEVEGWLQMDNAFLSDGTCWFNSEYYKSIQAASTNFGTEYEDGAIDHGVVICGKEHFNLFSVESNDRDPVIVFDPDFEVELDDNEYPVRFSVDAGDGEVWDWKRLPGNQAKIPPTTVENAPRWIQGYFVRRGETRTLKSADGWLESFKRDLEHLL